MSSSTLVQPGLIQIDSHQIKVYCGYLQSSDLSITNDRVFKSHTVESTNDSCWMTCSRIITKYLSNHHQLKITFVFLESVTYIVL